MRKPSPLILALLIAGTSLLGSNPARGSDPAATRQRVAPPPELQPGALLAGFHLITVRPGLDHVALVFGADEDEERVEVRLTARDDERPAYARTESYDIAYTAAAERLPRERREALMAALVAHLERHDPGGLADATPVVRAADSTPFDRSLFLVTALLLILFALALPMLLADVWRSLTRGGRAEAVAVLVVLGAGLALRLLVVPHQLVMWYSGYGLTSEALALEGVSRYGPAGQLLHHGLLYVFGADHLVVLVAHSVLGVLGALFAVAFLRRLVTTPYAAVAAAALLAFVPLFLRDHNSESLLVPAVLWTHAGLLALTGYLGEASGPRLWRLALAGVALTLAAFTRPEMLLVAPMAALLIATTTARHRSVLRQRWVEILVVLTPLAMLTALRLVVLTLRLDTEAALGNYAFLQEGLGALGPRLGWLLERNLAFRPDSFPLPVTLLALAAPFLAPRGGRGAVAALVALAALWLAVVLVDLPWVSAPRLEAPGLGLLAVAAGVSVGALLAAVRSSAARWLRPALAALLALAVAAASLPGAWRLWRPTHPDVEEDLIRRALARADDEGAYVLVRRSYTDAPFEATHLDFPDYLVTHGAPQGVVRGARAFLEEEAWRAEDEPVFFFLGTRCYLRPTGVQGIHPACAAVLDDLDASLVVGLSEDERDLLPRNGAAPLCDRDFPWCLVPPDRPLGLWRLHETEETDTRR